MGLRDIGSTLPPGFRFHPSDGELVCHYLFNKVSEEGGSELEGTMVEVDLHTREPWELPDVAKLGADEWYFFSFRDRKYATGSRTNRATKSGYWKATGKDRTVYDPAGMRVMVGMRKTLVFYSGRAPHGVKTGWVMHEFRLETPHSPPKEGWVLCRVFRKRKGEQSREAEAEAEEEEDLIVVSAAWQEERRAMGPPLCCAALQQEPTEGCVLRSSGPFLDCYTRFAAEMESTSCGGGGGEGDEEFGFWWNAGFEQGGLY